MSSVNVLKHALRNDDDVARLQPDIRLAFALLQQVRDTQGIFGLFPRRLVEADQASLVARRIFGKPANRDHCRSEEHTSELQSLMRISYAVFCLKKKKTTH